MGFEKKIPFQVLQEWPENFHFTGISRCTCCCKNFLIVDLDDIIEAFFWQGILPIEPHLKQIPDSLH